LLTFKIVGGERMSLSLMRHPKFGMLSWMQK
jgi:hypothetical protein